MEYLFAVAWLAWMGAFIWAIRHGTRKARQARQASEASMSAAEWFQPGPKRYAYTCACGTSVNTADRLDGKCGSCWADGFEAASERADRM